MFRFHGRYLDDGLAEIACEDAKTARGLESLRDRRKHLFIAAFLRRGFSYDSAILRELRFHGILPEAWTPDRIHVLVEQPRVEQFAHQEPDTTGGVEMVNVRKAVRIDAGKQRHMLGDFRNVGPGELDAGRGSHGDEVNGVVSRAAGGIEAHDAVDDRTL